MEGNWRRRSSFGSKIQCFSIIVDIALLDIWSGRDVPFVYRLFILWTCVKNPRNCNSYLYQCSHYGAHRVLQRVGVFGRAQTCEP